MAEKQAKQSYKDLKVWQEAMGLAEVCYRLTKLFPNAEMYGMITQIRRAAASVAANIAEGYGTEAQTDPFLKQRDTVGRMLRALIRSLQKPSA